MSKVMEELCPVDLLVEPEGPYVPLTPIDYPPVNSEADVTILSTKGASDET